MKTNIFKPGWMTLMELMKERESAESDAERHFWQNAIDCYFLYGRRIRRVQR